MSTPSPVNCASTPPRRPEARSAQAYVRLVRGGTLPQSPSQAPRLRLVLFGFAGGTITALLSLAKAFPPCIEVWGAEYPGRGLRWQCPLIRAIDPLLDELLPGLHELADRPLALLGFSMGAHVAYRLALRATFAPVGMIAISARPPGPDADALRGEQLTDAQLIRCLKALGGTPARILNMPALMDRFMPVMRADLHLCAEMARFAARRLPCPLLFLQGREDVVLADAHTPRWLDVAGGTATQSLLRAWPGGHFFHKGVEGMVAGVIADWLDRLTPAPAQRPIPANTVFA